MKHLVQNLALSLLLEQAVKVCAACVKGILLHIHSHHRCGLCDVQNVKPGFQLWCVTTLINKIVQILDRTRQKLLPCEAVHGCVSMDCCAHEL
jgi:hypothetical protein